MHTTYPNIKLDLTDAELSALSLAVEAKLATYGIVLCGREIVRRDDPQFADFHPDSHIGTLVTMARRLYAAKCGGNHGYRETIWRNGGR